MRIRGRSNERGSYAIGLRWRTGSGAKEEDPWTAVGAEGWGPGQAAWLGEDMNIRECCGEDTLGERRETKVWVRLLDRCP